MIGLQQMGQLARVPGEGGLPPHSETDKASNLVNILIRGASFPSLSSVEMANGGMLESSDGDAAMAWYRSCVSRIISTCSSLSWVPGKRSV